MMSRFKLTKLEFGYFSAGSATIYFVCSPFGWSFCWGIPCISAGSAGIFNCRLTVGRLLCQALLVKVFVKIVDSRRLESEKVTNSQGLLGQNLLVYFEGQLDVHVKMYVTVVFSWFSWCQVKSNSYGTVWSGSFSRTLLLLLLEFYSEARAMWSGSDFTAHFHYGFYLNYDFSLDRKLINHPGIVLE